MTTYIIKLNSMQVAVIEGNSFVLRDGFIFIRDDRKDIAAFPAENVNSIMEQAKPE